MSDAITLIKKLFVGLDLSGTIGLMGFDALSAILCVTSIALLILLDRTVTYDGKEVGEKSHIIVRSGAYVYAVTLIILFWLLLLSKDMISTFIYFQF